jgi:hypothetical protein
MSSSQQRPNISLRIKAIALAIDRGTIPVILTGVINFLLANHNLISYRFRLHRNDTEDTAVPRPDCG